MEVPAILGTVLKLKARIALAGILLLFVLAAPAFAAPSDVTKKERELRKLSNQLESMNDRLNGVVEDYNFARLKLDRTERKLSKARTELSRSEAKLATDTAIFNQRMSEIYREDSITMLDVILRSTSFNDLIVRYELLNRIARNDAATVAELKEARAAVKARKARLQAVQDDQQRDAGLIEKRKLAVKRAVAAQERLFAGKKDELAQLRTAEAKRQQELRREAFARAERLARAQAAAGQPRSTSKTSKKKLPERRVKFIEDAPAGDASRQSRVVSISLQYLGIPYVWGGSTPASGFDCSGFTAYVFRQVGVSLPHSSRAQAQLGRAVPLNKLQPGDLVFRGSPIHHVGIYIGGGKMIAAPQTGESVKISKIRKLTKARRVL